jgi:hypothetical protein
MEVTLDTPAIPITEEQTNAFLAPREPRDENLSVPTSVAFGEDRRFIMYGNTQEFTEYATAQEMIADQPPLPDPVFEPGDYAPWVYDTGAALDKLEVHALEFAELVQQMFEAGEDVRLTKEGIELMVERYKTDKDSPTT